MGLSKTAPNRLSAAERRSESVRLRREGATLDYIAAELHCSRTAVIKHLRTALADLAESTHTEAAEWRAMELERLDALHRAIWERALSGDLPTIDRVLRIMERRARMLALDGPHKVATTTPDGNEPSPTACVILPPTASSVDEWVQEYGANSKASGAMAEL